MVSLPNPAVIKDGHSKYIGERNYAVSHSGDSDAHSIDREKNGVSIPKLPFDLRENKGRVIIASYLLFFCCGGLPIILYFDLKYASTLGLQVVLAIPTVIFIICTFLFSFRRVWRLVLGGDKYRPIGARINHLDYFQYNFLFGFLYITPLLVASIVIANNNPDLAVRLFALPLPLIMIQACIQIVFGGLATLFHLRYPFQASSSVKGEAARPAVFTIIEDVVAVDGGSGIEFRAAWQERYASSPEITRHLARMDWIWGLSGLLVAITLIVLTWFVDVDAALALGWAAPWAWTVVCTAVTVNTTKRTLKREFASQTHVDT